MLRCSSTTQICTTSLRSCRSAHACGAATYLEIEQRHAPQHVLHECIQVRLLRKLGHVLGHRIAVCRQRRPLRHARTSVAVQQQLCLPQETRRLLGRLPSVFLAECRAATHLAAGVTRAGVGKPRERITQSACKLRRRARLGPEQPVHANTAPAADRRQVCWAAPRHRRVSLHMRTRCTCDFARGAASPTFSGSALATDGGECSTDRGVLRRGVRGGTCAPRVRVAARRRRVHRGARRARHASGPHRALCVVRAQVAATLTGQCARRCTC